jgi:glycosyltransferase involved in cell wall biosynthesis
MTKSCSILISSFHGGEATELCLESILKRTEYEPYKIVVFDSTGKDSGERKYLSKLEVEGRIGLLTHEERQSHGQAITALLKQCDTDFACLFDSDMEVLNGDWMSILVDQMTSSKDLGVARFISARVHYTDLLAPFFDSFCMVLNMNLYRQFKWDAYWENEQKKLEDYSYKSIFDSIEKPQNFSGFVYCDTEWRFTEKLLYENENGFVMKGLPPGFLGNSVYHYGGMSRNYFRPEHPEVAYRLYKIHQRLLELRASK